MWKHKALNIVSNRNGRSLFSQLISKINYQTLRLTPEQHFITMIYIHYLLKKKVQQLLSLFICFYTSVRTLDAAYSTLVRVNSSMPTVFSKECHTVRYFLFMLPSISYIFQTFSLVSGILFPHHPDKTFKCVKSQLIKEAYSSLPDFGSNILLKEVFLRQAFIRKEVETYTSQNFRSSNYM